MKIKGNEYTTVNERLIQFRKEHPEWTLKVEWLAIDKDIAIAKAIVQNEEGRTISEGTAMELAGSTFINKTSHIENCETSAWGRALGNLGYGIDNSVASAEEVANAVLNQNKKYIPEKEIDNLLKLAVNNGLDAMKFGGFIKTALMTKGKMSIKVIELVKDPKKLWDYLKKANAKLGYDCTDFYETLREWGQAL